MSSLDLISTWLSQVGRMKDAHYDASVYFERLNLLLGIPAVVLATLVGTTIFATIQQTTSLSLKIATGLLSVASAIFTGLQTFLRYGERAEKHRIAKAQYGVLKADLERLAVFPLEDSGKLEGELKSFSSRWADIRQASPTIPIGLIKKRLSNEGEMVRIREDAMIDF